MKRLEALRDSSIKELEAKLMELKATLSKEKAQVASGTRAEKPAKIRNARRGIARILTIIREKRAKAGASVAKARGAMGNAAEGLKAKAAKPGSAGNAEMKISGAEELKGKGVNA